VPDPLGLSFMPGESGATDPNKPQPSPVQQAIQTLSLRIPRTVGAASGAPQALLTSGGGSMLGGNPNAASILEQLRRLFMGGGANLGGPSASQSPAVGMPGAPMGNEPSVGGGTRFAPSFGFGDPEGDPINPPAAAPPPAPIGGGMGTRAPFEDRGDRRQI